MSMLGELQMSSEQNDPRIAAADFLFALLDDIDTASDLAKADDKAYRSLVERIQYRRFEVAATDGYTVRFKAAGAP